MFSRRAKVAIKGGRCGIYCYCVMFCSAHTEMKSGFSEEFPTIIKGLNPLVVGRLCLEGEIFDLRGENIANRGNLAVVQEEQGNIAEILGRKDLPHQTFLCWFSLVKPLRILETISQTNFCFKPVGLLALAYITFKKHISAI